MKKSYIMVLVVLSLVFSSCAGPSMPTPSPAVELGTIEGLVLSDTNSPLPGVTVSIKDSQLQAFTSKDGRYSIEDVPVGTNTLLFSKEGYTFTARVIKVSEDEKCLGPTAVLTKYGGTSSVGPEGGTIYGTDGTVITIPEGALDTVIDIRFTPLSPGSVPQLSIREEPSFVTGYAFELGPSGLALKKPIEITFPLGYLEGSAPEVFTLLAGTEGEVVSLNPESLDETSMTVRVNEDGRTVTMEIDHFSILEYVYWSLRYYTNVDYTGYVVPPREYIGNKPCGQDKVDCHQSFKRSVTVNFTGSASVGGLAAGYGVTVGTEVSRTVDIPLGGGEKVKKELYGFWCGRLIQGGIEGYFIGPGWCTIGSFEIFEPHNIKLEPPEVWPCPPNIQSMSPMDTASNVSVDKKITMEFCKSMNPSSVEKAITINPPLEFAVSWSEDNTILTLKPLEELDSNTTYTVTISTSAMCVDGYHLQESYVLSFSTEEKLDTEPPLIISTVPKSGETNVAIGTSIAVTFSEPMDKDSVESAFSIYPSVDGKFVWSDNTITFYSVVPLDYGVSYAVIINIEAKDLAGNSLAEAYSGEFSTKEAPE